MSVFCEKIIISTKGFNDVIDITSRVQDIVSSYEFRNAVINISTLSSTASIMTLEDEPGLAVDISKMLDDFAPVNKVYQHDTLWHDGNAFSHLKAALIGNNITLSAVDKKIELDRWQKIVLIDFDNKPSQKQIVVSLIV